MLCSCIPETFNGPHEQRMGAMAFLCIGVRMIGLGAFRKGFMGNVSGEDVAQLTFKLMQQLSVKCILYSKPNSFYSVAGNTPGANRD